MPGRKTRKHHVRLSRLSYRSTFRRHRLRGGDLTPPADTDRIPLRTLHQQIQLSKSPLKNDANAKRERKKQQLLEKLRKEAAIVIKRAAEADKRAAEAKKEADKARMQAKAAADLAKEFHEDMEARRKDDEKLKAENHAERKEKDKHPVDPPELYEMKSKLPDVYFDYLESVLRNIDNGEKYTGEVNGKKTVYYLLKEIIETLQNEITLVKKNTIEEYPMPNAAKRRVVLRELEKYIKFFNFVATRGRVPIKAQQILFDGID